VPRPETKPILDSKTLLKRYKLEVDELKITLQETNNELERQRMKDKEISVDERESYEAKLEDSRLVTHTNASLGLHWPEELIILQILYYHHKIFNFGRY
jgi:hypothetical protein